MIDDETAKEPAPFLPNWFFQPAPVRTSRAASRTGRPRKNGQKDIGVLIRAVLILSGYETARVEKKLHLESMRAACSYVESFFPAMRCSVSQVRMVLAEWHPSQGPAVWRSVASAAPSGTVTHALKLAARPAYPNRRVDTPAKMFSRKSKKT